MARLTTLQIIQKALSAINSDNVSSISETVESEQVKDILDTVYDKLLDDFPWYHLREFGTLEVTSTAHQMKIPNTVMQVNFVRYNKKDITYIDPYDMLVMLDGRDTTLTEVDANGAVNNRDPRYWTSYDDENIIFDGYDSSLVSSLSKCEFIRKPSVLSSEGDIPDLPDRLHTVLLDGVFEMVFRLIAGDKQNAVTHQRKYIVGLAKAKRWARKVNKKNTSYGSSYGRSNFRG